MNLQILKKCFKKLYPFGCKLNSTRIILSAVLGLKSKKVFFLHFLGILLIKPNLGSNKLESKQNFPNKFSHFIYLINKSLFRLKLSVFGWLLFGYFVAEGMSHRKGNLKRKKLKTRGATAFDIFNLKSNKRRFIYSSFSYREKGTSHFNYYNFLFKILNWK